MGAGHGHGHGHSDGRGGVETASGRHRTRLMISFAMVATFFVVELLAGIVTGSLALVSDAGHMAADVVALGAALVATRIATRPDSTGRRTYGSYRAEVFASGLAVLIMLGVSVYVVVEAVGRVGDDVEIQTGPVLVVGALGLLVNLISIALLRAGAQESLNLKGAYLEVMADTVGSIGVIAAAILVSLTGSSWWDTVVALAIGLFVAVRALMLGRQVLAVLGQHVPEGLAIEDVATALQQVPGVADVHDLHVWVLTSGMNVATAHLVVVEGADPQQVLAYAGTLLRRDHEIEHATLQVEASKTTSCAELAW